MATASKAARTYGLFGALTASIARNRVVLVTGVAASIPVIASIVDAVSAQACRVSAPATTRAGIRTSLC